MRFYFKLTNIGHSSNLHNIMLIWKNSIEWYSHCWLLMTFCPIANSLNSPGTGEKRHTYANKKCFLCFALPQTHRDMFTFILSATMELSKICKSTHLCTWMWHRCKNAYATHFAHRAREKATLFSVRPSVQNPSIGTKICAQDAWLSRLSLLRLLASALFVKRVTVTGHVCWQVGPRGITRQRSAGHCRMLGEENWRNQFRHRCEKPMQPAHDEDLIRRVPHTHVLCDGSRPKISFRAVVAWQRWAGKWQGWVARWLGAAPMNLVGNHPPTSLLLLMCCALWLQVSLDLIKEIRYCYSSHYNDYYKMCFNLALAAYAKGTEVVEWCCCFGTLVDRGCNANGFDINLFYVPRLFASSACNDIVPSLFFLLKAGLTRNFV